MRPQGRVVQRVGLEQARRKCNRLEGIELAREPGQGRVAPRRPQPVALVAQPAGPRLVGVVVEAGEQRSSVQGQRFGDAFLAQRLLERGDVRRHREAQRAALRLDRRQPGQPLEPKQRLAQVGVGELALLPGPQQGRELGAGHPLALHRQEGDELAAPLERQRVGLAVVLDGRGAEQRETSGHRCTGGERGTR